MRFKSTFLKISLVPGTLIVLFVVSMLWQERLPEGGKPSGMGIFLARPAFAQEDGVSFLEQEAGIATYMNAGQTIDLPKVKSAFRTVERETGQYVIGSVPLPNYPETHDVHAYVHRNGWIVIYYLRSEPAAKIVDWSDYDEDEKTVETKLEKGILMVGWAAEVPVNNVKYCDFRHSKANRLMVITGAAWRDEEDSFSVKLPADLISYERSFSHSDRGGRAGGSSLTINGESVSHLQAKETKYGLLSPTQLPVDVPNEIKVRVGSQLAWFGGVRYSYPALCAIVLVYQES